MKQTTKTIAKWLELPPAQWNQQLCHASNTDWATLVLGLELTACTCAMLAAYIETRKGTDGCGLKVHAAGVKAAKRTRVRVRRALEYTDPAAGTFDF